MVGPGGLNRAAQASDQWIMSPPIGAEIRLFQWTKRLLVNGSRAENGVSD